MILLLISHRRDLLSDNKPSLGLWCTHLTDPYSNPASYGRKNVAVHPRNKSSTMGFTANSSSSTIFSHSSMLAMISPVLTCGGTSLGSSRVRALPCQPWLYCSPPSHCCVEIELTHESIASRIFERVYTGPLAPLGPILASATSSMSLSGSERRRCGTRGIPTSPPC